MSTDSIFIAWTQFVLAALFIGVAGYYILLFADAISEKTGLGRNWIGAILIATVTSLPELMTGVSSVTLAQTPDLAVGDILGSCVFNLVLFFILDALDRERSVYSRASHGHILLGALGIILISFVGFSMFLREKDFAFSLGHIGGYSLFIPLFYLLAMRTVYKFEVEHTRTGQNPKKNKYHQLSLPSLITRYMLASTGVIVCGLFLPFIGKNIISLMEWNEAFVGTLLIALTTSLPEMAVTISAVQVGAVDLAFSNLLGSNIFNIIILAIDDAFYLKGPILESVSSFHVVTVLSAVMMTGLIIVGILHQPKKKYLNTVSGMSFLLLLVYLVNTYVMFKMGQS